MVVYDSFEGEVKIIKEESSRILIEIIDVLMCYPQQLPLNPGKRIWVNKSDVYKREDV